MPANGRWDLIRRLKFMYNVLFLTLYRSIFCTN